MTTLSELQSIGRGGIDALRRGDALAARRAFEAIAQAGAATPQSWLLLAQACEALGDVPACEAAADQVLSADGRNLYALTMKGAAVAARGDDRGACSFYELALASARAMADIPADLQARLARAQAAVDATAARFKAHLAAALADAPANAAPRFAEALRILRGEQEVYLQQPTSFYYPRLPQIAFYEADTFDWAAGLAAAAPAIRAELEAVLAADAGLVPYVEADPTRANRGHRLLDDKRWSAFHIWQNGAPVTANAARCPATMAALDALPLARVPGRGPMALFSVLAAQTHIPPHHGMLNTRLIVHLPLIVPDGCRLRVGGETRIVRANEPMIFDDSFEHEAWNDSDETRVVLITEIWRPELSDDERAGLAALFGAIGSYEGDASALSR